MQLKNCDVREFIHRAKGRKIVCFGAGQWAEKLSQYFPEYGIEEKFSYIVDNDQKLWGKKKIIKNTALGIYSPQKLYSEADNNTIILITIANSAEVYEQLEKEKNLRDIQCYCSIFLWAEETDRVSIEAIGPPNGWRMNETMVIPKTINYTWFGKDPMPETYKQCIESWKKHCPDYNIIEWNTKNYDVTNHQYMYDAYKSGRFGFAGDYARLDIIYKYGGVYLDVDVELMRPLDELLYNDAYMGYQDTDNVNLGHGFGAIKGFPLIKEFRDYYDNISAYLDDGTYNLEISPFIQTETLKKCGFTPDGSFQIFKGAAVYPARYLAGKNGTTGQMIANDETFSIHHYAWSWGNDVERAKREDMRRLLELTREKEKAVYSQ